MSKNSRPVVFGEDNPEWTEEVFAKAKRVEDLDEPERSMILANFPKTAARLAGRPRKANAKINLTLRVSPDIVEAYRETGPGWHKRMEDALRGGLQRKAG